MKKRIKIQGFLIFLAVITTILLSKFPFPYWKKEPLDEFLDAVGIVLVLFGFLFRIAARGYKEEESHSGQRLIKDGPYVLIRNPMYFGTFMIGMGIILVLFASWVVAIFLIIFFSIYIPQVKREEKELYKRFGEEYRNYCKITPKYFPNPRCLLNIRNCMSLKFAWIKKELSSLITVITGILIIEIWEDIKLFGRKEFLGELLELILIIVSFSIIVILVLGRAPSKE